MINLKNAKKLYVERLQNKNQFVVYYYDNDIEYIAFQSYQTLICIYCPTTKEMLVNWSYFDYSKTTSKHFKIFINEYTIYSYNTKQEFISIVKNNDKIKTY